MYWSGYVEVVGARKEREGEKGGGHEPREESEREGGRERERDFADRQNGTQIEGVEGRRGGGGGGGGCGRGIGEVRGQ